VLAADAANVVLRLSNVVGRARDMQSFLGQIVNEIESGDPLTLHSHPDSAKDYISLEAVGSVIEQVINSDAAGIYNVCNGFNISHRQWLEHLAQSRPFEWTADEAATGTVFPQISNARLRDVVGFTPETPAQIFAALTH
jgi:nucleoside-diphosphate-sugar epimerase